MKFRGVGSYFNKRCTALDYQSEKNSKSIQCSLETVFIAINAKNGPERSVKPSKMTSREKSTFMQILIKVVTIFFHQSTSNWKWYLCKWENNYKHNSAKQYCRSPREFPILKNTYRKTYAFFQIIPYPKQLRKNKQWRNIPWSNETKINLFVISRK